MLRCTVYIGSTPTLLLRLRNPSLPPKRWKRSTAALKGVTYKWDSYPYFDSNLLSSDFNFKLFMLLINFMYHKFKFFITSLMTSFSIGLRFVRVTICTPYSTFHNIIFLLFFYYYFPSPKQPYISSSFFISSLFYLSFLYSLSSLPKGTLMIFTIRCSYFLIKLLIYLIKYQKLF